MVSRTGELRCPSCHQARSRKHWRPTQWVQWTGGVQVATPVGDFYQCRVCDGETQDWTTWAGPGAGTAPPPTVPPVPTEEIQHIVDRLHCRMYSLRVDKVETFVAGWMELPKSFRKRLSYDGALRAYPSDPCHYQCPRTQQKYFDPSNAVYGLVIDMVCPKSATKWNIETKGDIIESLLGFHYNFSARSDVHAASAFVNNFFNDVTYYVYMLWCRVEWNHVVRWLQWIVSTRGSQLRSPLIAQEAGDPNYRPKNKSMGHLLLPLHPQEYGNASIAETDDSDSAEWVDCMHEGNKQDGKSMESIVQHWCRRR